MSLYYVQFCFCSCVLAIRYFLPPKFNCLPYISPGNNLEQFSLAELLSCLLATLTDSFSVNFLNPFFDLLKCGYECNLCNTKDA